MRKSEGIIMKKSGLKGKIRYNLMKYRKQKRLTTSKQIIDSQGAKWTGFLQKEVVHHPCVFFVCVPQHTNIYFTKPLLWGV